MSGWPWWKTAGWRSFTSEAGPENGPTGNIYKGRVVKLLPGMAAAFVNIGLERPAYLFAEDVSARKDEFFSLWLKDEPVEAALPAAPPRPHRRPPPRRPGDRGAGVAGPPGDQRGPPHHVHHPGRPLSGLLPTLPQLGISRRITDEAERQRLRPPWRN